jgi:hypothetical protein
VKLALSVTLCGFQGLGSTPDNRERPVDRLTAMARAEGPVERRSQEQCERGDRAAMESFLCSLGVDLIAFKFGHRIASKSEAELKLAIVLKWKQYNLKLTAAQSERVARWAITEWLLDFCPTCRGAKEIPNYQDVSGTQPMKPCSSCAGTGLRRYSDAERIDAMGEEFAAKGAAFDRAMGWALSLIAQSEALAVRLTKERLERW